MFMSIWVLADCKPDVSWRRSRTLRKSAGSTGMLVTIVDLWPVGTDLASEPCSASEVSEASITVFCMRNHIPQSGIMLDGFSLTPMLKGIVICLPLNSDIFWSIRHRMASWTSASNHSGGVEDHAHVDLHPSSKAEVKRAICVEISP